MVALRKRLRVSVWGEEARTLPGMQERDYRSDTGDKGLMTTKPSTTTQTREQWLKDIPRKGDWYVSGWYWQRRLSNHATQIIEVNQRGFTWAIGRTGTKFIIDLRDTGDYEWLGPIAPSDTEAVTRLREALEQIAAWGCRRGPEAFCLQEHLSNPCHVCVARAALQPKAETEGEQDATD